MIKAGRADTERKFKKSIPHIAMFDRCSSVSAELRSGYNVDVQICGIWKMDAPDKVKDISESVRVRTLTCGSVRVRSTRCP